MPRFECAPCHALAGSACDIAVPNTDSAARASTAELAHTRHSAFLLQPLLVPLTDVCKRSTLPEDALRAVVDSVGVIDWARCAAFLSKELRRTVPQDIVISFDDFGALSDLDTEVRSGLASFLIHRPFTLREVC